MSVQKRAALLMDTMWILPNINVIAAWRCNSKKDRDFVVEKLCKSFAGLHTHFENNELVFKKRDVPIFKIPSEIKDLVDQSEYVNLNCSRLPSIALGSISVSDDSVVLVGNHCVFDGGSITYFNKVITENLDVPPIGINPDSFAPFMNKINNINYYLPNWKSDENVLRVRSKDQDQVTSNPNGGFIPYYITKEQFSCYNQKDHKIHGLTESLFTSMVLIASAFNGKFNRTALFEVFGTRPFAEGYKLTQGQYFSNFTVYADSVTENDTIQTMMKKFRENMNYQLKIGAPWAALRGYRDNVSEDKPQIPGEGLVLSSLGEFVMKGPVKDLFIRTASKSEAVSNLSITSYNIKSINSASVNHTLIIKA